MDDSNNIERQATQIDPGWHHNSSNERQATQIDPGWRENNTKGHQATQTDTGWRENNPDASQATQIDADWRDKKSDSFDSPNVTNSATANYFSNIEEFKNAVEKITELRSSVGNVYSVKNTISRKGGESIVLLCSAPDGKDVAAKVYYEPINESRNHVLEYMKTDEGKKYTLAVSEIGNILFGESKYFFEIMPYCKSMDLSDDEAYSFEQLVEITRQLNEALNSIHQAGIIHRDIKPENLYCVDGKYKLGDFGIAKQGDNNLPNITSHIIGTNWYRAPETTRYIYVPASDYYSLGVTLASLFEGHFIFDDMTLKMRTIAQETERLPLKKYDNNREYLENLLNGLYRIDYKQRFGYEDVKCWLEDHNYTGGAQDEEWPRSFTLSYYDKEGKECKEKYDDEESMFLGITKDKMHWDSAKSQLYNKVIANFFSSFRTDLAAYAHDIADNQEFREKYPDKGLAQFLKKLYSPGPIAWKGYVFKSLSELGNKMVATKRPATYAELLQNKCISYWLRNTKFFEKPSDETKCIVNTIESLSATDREIACYWFGYSFAEKEKRKLEICNKNVTTIEELINVLFSSPNDFYQTDGYDKLLYRGGDLYGFLYSLGYKEIIDTTWVKLQPCKDEFYKFVFLISMLDTIAVKAGADPAIIRKFFTLYGPIGIATYVQKLVKEEVYAYFDDSGKRILKYINDFYVPSIGDVDSLYKAYEPLLDSVEKLRDVLIDNPHLILTGAYEKEGVICTNLKGCFAFSVFGRVAPLGFNAWIEKKEL